MKPLNEYSIRLVELFNKYNIHIYSLTGKNKNRELEIDDWLRGHDVSFFAIIDDDSSELIKYAKSNLIKTSKINDGEMIIGYDKITGLLLKTIFMLNRP